MSDRTLQSIPGVFIASINIPPRIAHSTHTLWVTTHLVRTIVRKMTKYISTLKTSQLKLYPQSFLQTASPSLLVAQKRQVQQDKRNEYLFNSRAMR